MQELWAFEKRQSLLGHPVCFVLPWIAFFRLISLGFISFYLAKPCFTRSYTAWPYLALFSLSGALCIWFHSRFFNRFHLYLGERDLAGKLRIKGHGRYDRGIVGVFGHHSIFLIETYIYYYWLNSSRILLWSKVVRETLLLSYWNVLKNDWNQDKMLIMEDMVTARNGH